MDAGAETSKRGLKHSARNGLGMARYPWFLWVAGLFLVGLHLAMAALSFEFSLGRSVAEMPVVEFEGLLLTASGVFLIAVFALRSVAPTRGAVLWVLGVGVLLRAIMLTSHPVLENDYCRYLLDGAMTANGCNPYEYAPQELLAGSERVSGRASGVALEGRTVLERVNHPGLKTIYPPVAQGVFAGAYLLAPWSLLSLRSVFLVFDFATLLLLLHALRSVGFSPLLILIYWWHPLMIKEFVNSVHMDVVVLPIVVVAVLLAGARKSILACGLLAVAVGAKLWPLVLLPVILRQELRSPRRVVLGLALFASLCMLIFYPMYSAGLDTGSGLVQYGKRWEMNDALYMLIMWGVEFLLNGFGFLGGTPHLVTRAIVLFILAAWTLVVLRRSAKEPVDLWRKCLAVAAAMLLLSPTQFPWYFSWLLPFLVIVPRWSLLVLGGLLPLYYLRFHFHALNRVQVFDYGIVWIEYVPVWVLLTCEWIRGTNGFGHLHGQKAPSDGMAHTMVE